ncbi:MAG: glycoside hydrolase family 9 protein [Chitinispirillaceae bacterium]|nr:glycoside hydrolase family 9 protein [Chitinispirillaceae bacterium]
MKKRIVCTAVLLAALQISGTSLDLGATHKKVIQFYGYQRAGLKTGSAYNLNSGWANASHNGDRYDDSHPLDGGWYDAGDYVKFGMNLAYSVYCLLKGYDYFPAGYSDEYKFDHSSGANQIPDILDEVKFATDYLCKAVINENTVILDVGHGPTDHQQGFSPPNDPDGRSGGEIYTCTGADIPLTYAACLACMSTLYRKYDAAYADQCLAKAKMAFTFGKKKIASNNLYCTPQGEFYDYEKDEQTKQYMNRDISDRMMPAGIELYRASDKSDPNYATYKEWARKSAGGFNCVGFEYISPLAAIEVWRQGLGGYGSLSGNVGFLKNKIQESGHFKGVFQNNGWGTAADVATAAFEFGLAYVVTANQADRDNYLSLCKTHLDWVTGKNSKNQSYVTGVNGGPSNIHYRTSSKRAIPGAVVSGPDPSGNWADNAERYEFTEVAINYNAGIVGAIGFLRALSNTSDDYVSMSTAFSATPTSDVDFSKNTVKFTAGFSKSVEWSVKINGLMGSKTFTKTSNSVSETWDGSADEGQFLSGEQVTASITINGNLVAQDLIKTAGKTVAIAKAKSVATSDKDQLLDDFDDADLTNKKGGLWANGGNITGLSATKLSATKVDDKSLLKIAGSVYASDNSTWLCAKSYLNKDTSATDLSAAKSVYFNLRGSKEVKIRVELEQEDVTPGEYHGVDLQVTMAENSYRVNLADFKQPDWKKTEKALNLKAIKTLRFAVYDSIGLINLFLDDVKIDTSGTSVKASEIHPNAHFRQVYSHGALQFAIPQLESGVLDCTIFNVAGKVALKRSFNTKSVNSITLPLSVLPSGMYTVVNTINGKPAATHLKIFHTR